MLSNNTSPHFLRFFFSNPSNSYLQLKYCCHTFKREMYETILLLVNCDMDFVYMLKFSTSLYVKRRRLHIVIRKFIKICMNVLQLLCLMQFKLTTKCIASVTSILAMFYVRNNLIYARTDTPAVVHSKQTKPCHFVLLIGPTVGQCVYKTLNC